LHREIIYRAKPSYSVVLSRLVLLGGYFLHPFDDLAVECFLDGDVRHCRRGCSAVPMPFIRRTPDDIAWFDFDFWLAFTLYPATAGDDD